MRRSQQLKIEVNGIEIEAGDGLTILEALKEHGIKIPTLCYLEELIPPVRAVYAWWKLKE